MVIHNPLTRSVALISAFWWMVLTCLAVVYHPRVFFSFHGFGLAIRYSAVAAAGLLLGTICGIGWVLSVSYTHLTLPTIYSV